MEPTVNNNNTNGGSDAVSLLNELSLLDYKNCELTRKYLDLFMNSLVIKKDEKKARSSVNFTIAALYSLEKQHRDENLFKQKISELRSKNGDVQHRYAFTISNTYEKLKKVIKYGLSCDNSDFSCLGPSKKGVYMCLSPDIMLDFVQNEYTFLVIHEIILSKTCKFNLESNNEPVPEPDPLMYDSHMSKTRVQNVKTSLSESQKVLLYKNSLIYLFDYDLKSKLYVKRPRQISPIAVFLMKNTQQQPPSSQSLKKSLMLLSPLPPMSPISPSSSASTTNEQDVVLKKSSLLTLDVLKKIKAEMCTNETQTPIVVARDVCVQTDNEVNVSVEDTIVASSQVEPEEEVYGEDEEYIEPINIICDIEGSSYNNNDDMSLSPLPTLESVYTPPLTTTEHVVETSESPKSPVLEARTVELEPITDESSNEPPTVEETKLPLLILESQPELVTDESSNEPQAVKVTKIASPITVPQQPETITFKKRVKKRVFAFKRRISKLSSRLLKRAAKFKPSRNTSKVDLSESKEGVISVSTLPLPLDILQQEKEEEKNEQNYYSNISSASSSSPSPSVTRSNSVSRVIGDETFELEHQPQVVQPVQSIPSLLSIHVDLPPLTEYQINMYWETLYFAFKFLSCGVLIVKATFDDLDLISAHQKVNQYDFRSLEKDIYSVKELENPFDPSDTNKSYQWNNTSTIEYKLIKIKYSLVYRLSHILESYYRESKISQKPFYTPVDHLKLHCLKRIDDYVKKWKPVLSDLIEDFTTTRGTFPMNSNEELEQFIENNDDIYRSLVNNEQIDLCFDKIYYFLQLIIKPDDEMHTIADEIKWFFEKSKDFHIKRVLSMRQQHATTKLENGCFKLEQQASSPPPQSPPRNRYVKHQNNNFNRDHYKNKYYRRKRSRSREEDNSSSSKERCHPFSVNNKRLKL